MLTVLLTAGGFSVLHAFGGWVFTGGTFVLGLIYTPLYLQFHQLYPLGLLHGWLGVFFYFWVLRKDPWSEMFT